MRIFILPFLLLFGPLAVWGQLPQGHAHNDYEHRRPLQDAIDYGFTSIEVDVHLVEGELYVSHDPPERKRRRRTLRRLYLDPLQRRIENNGGRVYPGYEGSFFLMIDIKTAAEPTYQVMRRQLAAYRSMLTTYSGDHKEPGAVTVFLSGNRPFDQLKQQSERLVALDGRPSDIGMGYSPDLMPVISDHYRNHLSWKGEGLVPAGEKAYLQSLCEQVRQEGKRLRLWASPEKEEVWELLLECGIGFISTDELARFHRFRNR